MKIMKRYKPVFYQGHSIDTEESYETLEQAEERIEDRALRAQWDRDEPFDYAEVKTIYIPWEDDGE